MVVSARHQVEAIAVKKRQPRFPNAFVGSIAVARRAHGILMHLAPAELRAITRGLVACAFEAQEIKTVVAGSSPYVRWICSGVPSADAGLVSRENPISDPAAVRPARPAPFRRERRVSDDRLEPASRAGFIFGDFFWFSFITSNPTKLVLFQLIIVARRARLYNSPWASGASRLHRPTEKSY
jgi:hypothetical protein